MAQSSVQVENILELIGGTPLVRLRRLPEQLAEPNAAEVWVKCEQFNPGGSVKDRIALAMIEAAERDGRITPGRVVIVEPTSGNTGIGLALVCAVKGYRLVLTMPESMSLERRSLLKAYGAELILTPAERTMEGAVARAEELCRKNTNHFMPQQFNNPAESGGASAHHGAGADRAAQRSTEGGCDAFVAGVGTGGTITGVGEVFKRQVSGRADHRRRAGDLGGALGRAGRAAQDPGHRRRLRAGDLESQRHRRDAARERSRRLRDQGRAGQGRGPARRHLVGRERVRRRARWRSELGAGQARRHRACATPASATSRSTSTLREPRSRHWRGRARLPCPAGAGAARVDGRHRRRRRRRDVEPASADPASHRGRGTRPRCRARADAVRRRFPSRRRGDAALARRAGQRRRGRARLGRRRRRHRLVRRQVPDQRRLRARGHSAGARRRACASPASSCRSWRARPAIAACSRRRRRRASRRRARRRASLGAFAGVIGALMADEALAILDGKPRSAGTLLVVDGLDDHRPPQSRFDRVRGCDSASLVRRSPCD